MRRYLVATVCCGVLIAGCAIATAVVLGHLVAGIITDPATRSLGYWRPALLILLALWTVRALAQWLQARLGQRGASEVIADLSGQVLRSGCEGAGEQHQPYPSVGVHSNALLLAELASVPGVAAS